MALILSLMLSALSVDAYSVTYTSCGVEHTLTKMPERIVTLNQGATELMFALGLADKMVGTAYLDDYIWPQYATDYAKIPVLASSYPNETTIMSVSPDFIVGSYMSAFYETYIDSKNRSKGIFSSDTVGPCRGTGSEWGEGDGKKITCRPQLHAAGIGTFLFADACEDKSLRPSEVTEETVYSEMRTLGSIFKVDVEAMIKVMQDDFNSAGAMVSTQNHGKKLSAVWLDCVGRCCKDAPVPQVFVGSGQGAPNMLMKEAGFTNAFGNEEGGWACVNVSALTAMDIDVLVVVDASWDTALDKITWLYNHSDFCDMDVMQGARFVQIPFSASTLGPRNGPASLDLAISALHVRLGSLTSSRQSGVSSFNPHFLESHTKELKCNLKEEKILYGDEEPTTKPTTKPATKPATEDGGSADATSANGATTKAPSASGGTTAGPSSGTTTLDSVQEASGHPQIQVALGLWLWALAWLGH